MKTSDKIPSQNKEQPAESFRCERDDLRKKEDELKDQLATELMPVSNYIAQQLDRSVTKIEFPAIIPLSDTDHNDKDRLEYLYDKKITELCRNYLEQIAKKPALANNTSLYEATKRTITKIQSAIQKERAGSHSDACSVVKELLMECKKVPFFVSDLDCSYAFRGVAPFKELRSKFVDYNFYEKQLNTPLTFFRCRGGRIKTRDNMLHPPLETRGIYSVGRYSLPEVPCLYLATTTYCCWKELKEPKTAMTAVAFKANRQGKKLKILNMIVTPNLINGIDYDVYKDMTQLTYDMRRLFPLMLAASVSFRPEDKLIFRPEYTLPNLIMCCLKELGIDGIAYMSTKGVDDFQFPQGINLALPVFDNADRGYGQICQCFEETDPREFSYLSLDQKTGKKPVARSYVNSIEWTSFTGSVDYSGSRIPYSETPFATLDDELVSGNFYPVPQIK